jgi:hypothetical protein
MKKILFSTAMLMWCYGANGVLAWPSVVIPDPITSEPIENLRIRTDSLKRFVYSDSILNDVTVKDEDNLVNSVYNKNAGLLIKVDNLEKNYLKQSDAANTYLKQDTATSTYLKQDTATNTYLTKDTATNIYATKTDLNNLETRVNNDKQAHDGKITSLEGQLNNLGTRIDNEKQIHNEKITSLEGQLKNATESIITTLNNYVKFSGEYATFSQQYAAFLQQYATLNNDHVELKKQNTTLIANQEKINNECLAIKNNINDLGQKVSAAEDKVSLLHASKLDFSKKTTMASGTTTTSRGIIFCRVQHTISPGKSLSHYVKMNGTQMYSSEATLLSWQGNGLQLTDTHACHIPVSAGVMIESDMMIDFIPYF